MGVIVVIVYVAAIWLALAILTIGLLNLVKWRIRAEARGAGTGPPKTPASHRSPPWPMPDRTSHGTSPPRVAHRAASARPKPTG